MVAAWCPAFCRPSGLHRVSVFEVTDSEGLRVSNGQFGRSVTSEPRQGICPVARSDSFARVSVVRTPILRAGVCAATVA